MMLIRMSFAVIATLVTTMATADVGKAAYASCIACHGDKAQGNPSLKAPALAGQQADYLARQISHFKSGQRGSAEGDKTGAQMKAMASLIKEEDIQPLSLYLASLPQVKPEKTINGDIQKGATLYNGNCSDCHGAQAQGIASLSAAKLTGLSDSYLKEQFIKFQQSQRGYEKADKKGRQMQFISDGLSSEADIDAVVSYIQSLSEQL